VGPGSPHSRGTNAEGQAHGRLRLTELQISPATQDDLATILDILEQAAAWLHSKGIVQWQIGEFRGRQLGSITAGIEQGEFHLARLGYSVVGTMRLQWSDPRCWPDVADDDAGYLHSLAIGRDWAGRGLGRRMLEWAEAEVAATGRAYLRLDCVAHNHALVRYYQNAGFIARGERMIHWGNGGISTQARFEKRVFPPT
jgi:ribosomal protein S18 acetylase RimI-like enzyme